MNKKSERSKSVRSRKTLVKDPTSSGKQAPGSNAGSGSRSVSRPRSAAQRRNAYAPGHVSGSTTAGLGHGLSNSQGENGDEA